MGFPVDVQPQESKVRRTAMCPKEAERRATVAEPVIVEEFYDFI
jgi:hypothetical protein